MPDDAAATGPLPIRRQDDTIVVELPEWARRFVVDTAEAVQRSVEDPSSPGFERLYGRLDESAEVDDPLVILQRQTTIDEICGTVIGSAPKGGLSELEAEAWLRMLGMAVTIIAANAGIHTDDDLELLDPELAQLLDLLRSLQVLLARSLDPALGEPADPGGPASS